MNFSPSSALRFLFDPLHGDTNRLLPRWLFLRALGFIYFSAFFSLVFQIRGLIGPSGILPASEYLRAVTNSIGCFGTVAAPATARCKRSAALRIGSNESILQSRKDSSLRCCSSLNPDPRTASSNV